MGYAAVMLGYMEMDGRVTNRVVITNVCTAQSPADLMGNVIMPVAAAGLRQLEGLSLARAG